MADIINEYGVNVSHFASKVNEWAIDKSDALGRDVTFLEAFARWLDYVHPEGWRITEAIRTDLSHTHSRHMAGYTKL